MMSYIMRRYLWVVLILSLMLSGCPSSDDDYIPPATSQGNQEIGEDQGEDDKGQGEGYSDPFEANGLTIIDQVTIDNDTGYLAEDKNGKPYLILQGSFYNMGYQMGALMPEATFLMTTEYILEVAKGVLGVSKGDASFLYDFLQEELMILCYDAINSRAIPSYLIEEMLGLVDGANDAGYDVEFDNVLLLNEGYDALYSIAFTGKLPCMKKLEDLLKDFPGLSDFVRIQDGRVVFPKANLPVFGCNEFVVSDGATADGSPFHGRDFMFHTGGIYQDVACMGIYLPDKGYPFVCVTAPGFVGLTTALNSEGLSMGVDVVVAGCTRSDPGLSCLLIMRDIIQNSSNLDEAIERMKVQDRGVSWLYAIADDEKSALYNNTYGMIVEEGMSDPEFNGPDLLPDWEYWLLSGAPIPVGNDMVHLLPDYIGRLDEEPLPERGIMIRDQTWQFPAAFRDINISIPTEDGTKHIGVYFPDQIETWPDVVIATNHYIIPRMRFTNFTPWISIIEDIFKSLWRYETLFGFMEGEYGSIDFDTARDLIDFLNPNSVYGDTGYYKPGGEVKGHHAIIDNKNLIMEALFGYYGPDPDHRTPWARVDLAEFISE